MAEYRKESHLRSLLKGFTWRIIATATTISIAYFITGEVSDALMIGGIEFFGKLLIYYLHERAWQLAPIGTLRNLLKKEKLTDHIHPIFDRLLARENREKCLRQKSKVLWFTGLSGSGKSTIAQAFEKYLFNKGYFAQVLDGDNIRSGINNNLGFSIEDRIENIRRISEIAKLYLNSGIIVINSFISPTQEIRDMAKEIIGENDFIEVYVHASLATCEDRDVKGLYKKARAGEIKGFTGIDSPFEIPQEPQIILDTEKYNLQTCIVQLYQYLEPMIKLNLNA